MSERVRYVATVNVPGYSPERDPMYFDTTGEAWSWLLAERERDLDDPMNDEDDTGDDATEELAGWVDDPDVGMVWGRTPGSDSEHDLGLCYSVNVLAHSDYPHEAGWLHDCAACEQFCWCVDDVSATLCVHCGTVESGESTCVDDVCGSVHH